MAPSPGFKMMFALMRFRAVASRMRLRKRSDFGVASTYSSQSIDSTFTV